jgi:uncharacterized protein YggU (UPF0235/DUF167 family)
VRIRLTPKAAQSRIEGVGAGAYGAAVLKVAVTAPPERGKANAAMITLLAKAWRLPKTTMAITAGATARRKTLLVEGDGKALAARLNRWMEGRHG